MKLWRNRLIIVGVVAFGILAYVIYLNSFTIYDFGHLTRTNDFGQRRDFVPMAGSEVDGMVMAAETGTLALYINPEDTSIAVVDRRNGHVWHSTPPGTEQDAIANPFEQGTMRSHIGFRFFDEGRRRHTRWLYPEAKVNDQFEISSIQDGVRIRYQIGSLDIGIDALPFFIEEELFDERVRSMAEERNDVNLLRQFWHVSQTEEGFMQMSDRIRYSVINTNSMLDFFYRIGWTHEDTEAANALLGIEPEIEFEYFSLAIEFVLDDDRLIVNVPLEDFYTTTPSLPFDIDLMKFFGAGGTDVDGFVLVPSGSGGVINFNNGKQNEEPFIGAVYGLDNLMNVIRPQVVQPIRLPVFGMQNDGAAFLAQVYSGQALAGIHADVAGRNNSYNHAWFRFTLRSSMVINMAGVPGASGNMEVVQEDTYTGDITVVYRFLAGDNPGLGEMAEAYREFLIDRGAMTPLDGPGDRSFYMDIIGAIDMQRHILGTPFMATEVMTSLEDAGRFVDMLNEGGIDTVQMQLHGWFNRGINHDVAKRVNRINSVGSRQEMLDLNARLQENGGGLHPAVNFKLTNWFSRNMNHTFEVAKDPAGYIGFMSRTARDALSTRWSHHRNDWFLLVHPAVLPFHMDRFIPAYGRNTGMDGLALTDLGDILTESMFRRDPVDREHSRLIVVEQFERLQEAVPNLVVFGGNDYSFAFASHIVDAPTEADMFQIIDYAVPFFPMVVHGFIEFAASPANMRDNYSAISVLLNSMTTGASPRYIITAEPSRNTQFSPHERFYSTQYTQWLDAAMEHYRTFNDVFRYLRAEPIVDFEVLDIIDGNQVTVTVFGDGTRIYVNNAAEDVVANGVSIPQEWFVVQ